jgi:hypothetical protein
MSGSVQTIWQRSFAQIIPCLLLVAAATACSSGSVFAITTTWRTGGTSDWHQSSNWTNGVPQIAGDIAQFSNPVFAIVQAQLNTPISLGQLRFSGRDIFEISGLGSIAFSDPIEGMAGIYLNPQGNTLTPTVGVPIVIDTATLSIVAQGQSRVHLRLNGPISGNGAMAYSGRPPTGSVVTIRGLNSYTGLTTIDLGTGASVDAGSSTAFGDPGQGTIVRSGWVTLSQPTAEPFVVHRNAILAPKPTATPHLGKITLEGGVLNADGGSLTTIASEITIRGQGYLGLSPSIMADTILTGPITGGGLLIFQGSTSETITTRGAIELRGDVKASDRSNAIIEGSFRPTGDLILDARNSFARLRLAGDANDFSGDIEARSGFLTVSANARANRLRVDARVPTQRPSLLLGGVTVDPNAALDVNAIDFFAGDIAGRITGLDEVVKLTPVIGSLSRLDGFDGRIEIREGWLEVKDSGGLGTMVGATFVPTRHGAGVVLGDGRVHDAIYLNNTAGVEYTGGLIGGAGELAGALHLGDQGSYIAGQGGDPTTGITRGGNLHISGTIHGGSLYKVGPYTDLTISDAGHTYSGRTEIIGGVLILTDAGRLASTSEILLGGGRINHSGNPRASLRLDNRRGTASQDRVADDVPVRLDSGLIELIGTGPSQSSETIGRVILDSGYNRIWSTAASLQINELVREPGSVGIFLPSESGQIDIANPALDDGLLGGWALFAREDYRPEAFATIGPNGVVAATPFIEQPLNNSMPNQNVKLVSQHILDHDVGVNAVHFGSFFDDVLVDLNGHRLTIESGGLLVLGPTRIDNGELTAGSNGPGELIVHNYHGVELDASIVDNGSGPVTLHIAGNFDVPLNGINVYSGGTIVSRSARLHIRSRRAVPVGDVLTLNSGQYHVDFTDSTPLQFERIVMREDAAIIGSGRTAIDAETYELYSGIIDMPLAGDGMLIKRGEGDAEIRGLSPGFVGPIIVAQGVLHIPEGTTLGGAGAAEEQAITVLPDGVLHGDAITDQRLIILKGGKFFSGGFTGDRRILRAPIKVDGSGTVQTTHNGTSLSIEGRIYGQGDLILQGPFDSVLQAKSDFDELDGNIVLTGGAVHVSANNSAFTGKTIIRAAGADVTHTHGIGPAGAVIERDGILRSYNDLHGPIELAGGVLGSATQRMTLFGGLSIAADSRVDTPESLDSNPQIRNLLVTGAVTFADGVRLKKSGPGTLTLRGPIRVGASNEIVAWEGGVQINGQVEAATPTSVLNMVGNDNINFFSSLNVPDGRSFQLMEDGAPADLQFALPSLRLTGGGTIIGDIQVSGGSLIAPGANDGALTGQLTVGGNVDLGNGSVVEVGISGLIPGTQHDQLQVSGIVQVGGVLHVSILNAGNGFQLPKAGDEFTLINAAGGIAGSFDNAESLTSRGAGSIIDWAILNDANRLILKATAVTQLIAGDYNADGRVNAADYVVWRKTVGSMSHLAADGNADGLVDHLDYQVWRGHFSETAAAGAFRNPGADQLVPEPVSALLLLWAAVLNFAHVRRSRGTYDH